MDKFTSNIEDVVTKNSDIISFNLGDETYVLPLERVEESSLLLPSGVGLITVASGLTVYSKKKNKKSKV